MPRVCFNCRKKISENHPICPYCFVIQRKNYSKDEIFNYLEKYLPTKLVSKSKITTINKLVPFFDFDFWISRSFLSLGIFYFYYILLTLKALNDHLYLPHKAFEESTKMDMFILTLFSFSGIFGLPFIQYIRFERLRKHLIKAPIEDHEKIKLTKGVLILALYLILILFLSGVIIMLFFGLSSILAGRFFEFNSTFLTVIFFIGAFIIFILTLFFILILFLFDNKWQMIFNKHIKWHYSQFDEYE